MMIVQSDYVQTLTSLDRFCGLHVCSLSHSSGGSSSNLRPSTRLCFRILFEWVARILAFCVIKVNPPLAILIFNAPKRTKDAFYYQMSNVYAILITCSVSLFQPNITRLHATIAIFIASSPVSIYLLVYSIRGFWGEHRLDVVLGKRNYLNRGLVFLAAGIWIAIVVYTSLNSTKGRFAQASCITLTAQEMFALQGTLVVPPIGVAAIAALSWAFSVVLARKEIWPPGERYRPKFITVW
jgi:hypothetical protein